MGYYVNVAEVVHRSGLPPHTLCKQIGFASNTLYQWLDAYREPLLFHASYFGRVTGYSLDALMREAELGDPDIEVVHDAPPPTKRGCVRFGAAISQAIGSRSLSEIADASGLPRSTFHTWRTGQSAPKLHAAARLADVLGVHLHDLALGSVRWVSSSAKRSSGT
jgi:transposase-like protein